MKKRMLKVVASGVLMAVSMGYGADREERTSTSPHNTISVFDSSGPADAHRSHSHDIPATPLEEQITRAFNNLGINRQLLDVAEEVLEQVVSEDDTQRIIASLAGVAVQLHEDLSLLLSSQAANEATPDDANKGEVVDSSHMLEHSAYGAICSADFVPTIEIGAERGDFPTQTEFYQAGAPFFNASLLGCLDGQGGVYPSKRSSAASSPAPVVRQLSTHSYYDGSTENVELLTETGGLRSLAISPAPQPEEQRVEALAGESASVEVATKDMSAVIVACSGLHSPVPVMVEDGEQVEFAEKVSLECELQQGLDKDCASTKNICGSLEVDAEVSVATLEPYGFFYNLSWPTEKRFWEITNEEAERLLREGYVRVSEAGKIERIKAISEDDLFCRAAQKKSLVAAASKKLGKLIPKVLRKKKKQADAAGTNTSCIEGSAVLVSRSCVDAFVVNAKEAWSLALSLHQNRMRQGDGTVEDDGVEMEDGPASDLFDLVEQRIKKDAKSAGIELKAL